DPETGSCHQEKNDSGTGQIVLEEVCPQFAEIILLVHPRYDPQSPRPDIAVGSYLLLAGSCGAVFAQTAAAVGADPVDMRLTGQALALILGVNNQGALFVQQEEITAFADLRVVDKLLEILLFVGIGPDGGNVGDAVFQGVGNGGDIGLHDGDDLPLGNDIGDGNAQDDRQAAEDQ